MDFYVLLGLERSARLVEIKRAYRRLARRHHPDINPGDEHAASAFRQITEAYETLVDPDRRRRYDSGENAGGVQEVTVGFQGFDFSASASGAAASTFGELFSELLGQRAGAPTDGSVERGADLHHHLSLGFEDAVRGGQHALTVTRQERCTMCAGRGRLQVADRACQDCGGAGLLRSQRGHMVFSKPCRPCGGTGRISTARCPVCHGNQVVVRAEPLTIATPPGLGDGARIRVGGKGHAGRNGGEHGDLYVTVHVQPHPLFRREGDDLHLVVPVAVHEAALGTRFEVPTLDGGARIRVPPGTQSGQRFRLRERGVTSIRDGQRGDLVVEVRIVLPPLLDERSKELLREFGRINGEDVRKGMTAPGV
jgi:molecular chaperone DnaJ